MLLACERCHRQYDVGHLGTGARLRCFCGEVRLVPARVEKPVRMLHCSRCGGKLAPGVPGHAATSCAYCGAAVALGDRGLGEACPECLARMVKDARFCSSCGVAIRPESVVKAFRSKGCPRCKAELVLCETPSGVYVECSSCGGVWLEEAAFERFVEEAEEKTLATLIPSASGPNAPAPPGAESVRYLPCPTCGELMNRKNFASTSGIVVDWCRGHGYWFDADELERIRRFVDGGGLEKARERMHLWRKLELEKAERDARRAHAASAAVPIAEGQRLERFDLIGVLAALLRRLLSG